MLLGRILDQTTARWPDAEAMVQHDQRLTYREWYTRVNQVATALRRRGIGTGDRVATLSRNRISTVTMFFAAQKIGAIPVLMNFRLSEANIKHIVSTAKPVAILYEADRATALASHSQAFDSVEYYLSTGETPGSEHKSIPGEPFVEFARDTLSSPISTEIGPSDVAVLMHTSGTTGRPKLVKTTHHSVWANALACATELGYRGTDRALHIAPLFHSAGYLNLLMPGMLVGATHVMHPRFDAEKAIGLLHTEEATTTLGIPTQLERIRDASAGDSTSPELRLVVSTGAPIPDDLVEWVSSTLADRFYNVYGLTETTGLVTIRDPTRPAARSDDYCIGHAFLNVDVRLIEQTADALPSETVEPGELGRLIVRAPKLMEGYLGLPEETDQTLHGEWLYTNDLAVKGADGRFYLRDRLDNVIISGGENIYPLEVERVLREHHAVQDCLVTGEPDPDLGERVVAYVVSDGELSIDELDRYWRTEQSIVADFKRPRALYVVEELPEDL